MHLRPKSSSIELTGELTFDHQSCYTVRFYKYLCFSNHNRERLTFPVSLDKPGTSHPTHPASEAIPSKPPCPRRFHLTADASPSQRITVWVKIYPKQSTPPHGQSLLLQPIPFRQSSTHLHHLRHPLASRHRSTAGHYTVRMTPSLCVRNQRHLIKGIFQGLLIASMARCWNRH